MSDSPDNGRVTLAIIGEKLDAIDRRISQMCTQCADHEQRIRHAERWSDTSSERWRTHEREHTDLRGELTARGRVETIVAALVAAVPGLGALLIPKP